MRKDQFRSAALRKAGSSSLRRFSCAQTALAALALGCFFPAGAYAQNANEAEETASEAEEAASEAEEAADDERDDDGEVIVVTALRRGELSLLETPIAVTAFGGEDLEDRGLAGLGDFIQLAPGATLISNVPGSNRIQLRGIAGDTGESNVGFYLNEVPMAFINQANLPDFRSFDLERVEVLRGPQGTLYGAGAVAGVIRTITRPPLLNEFEARGDFSLSSTEGGEESYEANIALNAPIIPDRLAIRGVYIQESLGGWIDQTRLGIDDYNDTDTKVFRVNLLGRVTDQLKISALYWGSRIDHVGNNRAFEDGTLNEAAKAFGSADYDIYNLTANYEAGNIALVSSTSYSEMISDRVENFFGGFTLESLLDPSTFTQEVRVYSNDDASVWQWSAGAFYRDAEQTQSQNSAAFPLFGIDPILQFDEVNSWSVFGEVTRRFLNGRLDVTAGVRYLNETRRSEQKVRVSTPYENDFSSWAPRFNISYKPNDNFMTYFNYGRGVRSGINQFAVSLETAEAFGVFLPSEIDPEYVDSFEVGMKGRLFNERVTYDLAAFLINWRDRQISVPIVQFVLDGITNASKVRSPGVEAAINWEIIDNLDIGLIGAWNGASVEDDLVVDVAELDFVTGLPSGRIIKQTVLTAGSRVSGVPEYTLGGTIAYSRALSNSLSIFGNATAQYAAPNVIVGPNFELVGASLFRLDSRVGLNFRNMSIALFGRNLTNESGAVTANFIGIGARYRPRTIGVNLKMDF